MRHPSRRRRLHWDHLEGRRLLSTFVVSNVDDSGAGSLRQAILDANGQVNSGGADLIRFAIPGEGVHTIRPLVALPEITDPVAIDGRTQAGYAGKPLIELDGTMDASHSRGLSLKSGNSTIAGLAINRFADIGLLVSGGGSSLIKANFVGTDPTGSISLGNGGEGIRVDGSPSNTIGGVASADGNLLSGNLRGGLQLVGPASSGNLVIGNLVGTNLEGSAVFPGVLVGISIEQQANNNTIGGTTPGAGNLVSGAGTAIGMNGPGSNGNLVLGNRVGLNRAGTASLGNTIGISIGTSALGNTIGGTAPGAANIVIGSTNIGVFLAGADANRVEGNLLGATTERGTAFPNATGVLLDYQSINNTVSGNLILNSTANGVYLGSLSGNRIDANTVRGSGGDGIVLWANPGNSAVGNLIERNARHGIFVLGSSSIVTDNIIRDNGGDGILVGHVRLLANGSGNTLRRNLISGNGKLGIDLNDDGSGHGDGVTPNHALPVLDGPNLFQAAPVLTRSTFSEGRVGLEGTLDFSPNATYTIDSYAGRTPDPSGHGQAERYLGAFDVKTDPTGHSSFNNALAALVDPSDWITATATDAAGNTSEFSADLTPVAAPTVVSVTPSQVVLNRVGAVLVTFSAPVPSFVPSDLTIAGPGGIQDPSRRSIVRVDDRTFRVLLLSGLEDGTNTVNVRRGILDTTGKATLNAFSATVLQNSPKLDPGPPRALVSGLSVSDYDASPQSPLRLIVPGAGDGDSVSFIFGVEAFYAPVVNADPFTIRLIRADGSITTIATTHADGVYQIPPIAWSAGSSLDCYFSGNASFNDTTHFANVTVTKGPINPPPPNPMHFAISSFSRTDSGGVQFRYEIVGLDPQKVSIPIQVYYALPGSTQPINGGKTGMIYQASASSSLNYKPIVLSKSPNFKPNVSMPSQPKGATHIIFAVDPNDSFRDVDHSLTLQDLALPDTSIVSFKFADEGFLDIGYAITGDAIPAKEQAKVAVVWGQNGKKVPGAAYFITEAPMDHANDGKVHPLHLFYNSHIANRPAGKDYLGYELTHPPKGANDLLVVTDYNNQVEEPTRDNNFLPVSGGYYLQDNRQLITDVSNPPGSLIVQITGTFRTGGTTPLDYTVGGTGVLIDPTHVLTVMHTLYPRELLPGIAGFAYHVQIAQGVTPSHPSRLTARAVKIHGLRTFLDPSLDDLNPKIIGNDLAVLTIDRPFDPANGEYFKVGAPTDSQLFGSRLFGGGYPANSDTLLFGPDNAPVLAVDPAAIYTRIFVGHGQSGGPIYTHVGPDRTIVGLIEGGQFRTSGNPPMTGFFETHLTRLTSGKLKDIARWLTDLATTEPPLKPPKASDGLPEFVSKLPWTLSQKRFVP